MSTYRAVLVDLDGTLLRADETVSDRTLCVLETVRRQGIPVMIVTGRSIEGALRPFESWPHPICCYNGAVVYDPVAQEWLRHYTLGEQISTQIVRTWAHSELEFLVYANDIKYTLAPRNDEYRELLERFEAQHLIVEESQLPTSGLTRISGFGPPHVVDEKRAPLESRHTHEVYIECYPLRELPGFARFSGTWCDIQPICRGKAEALSYLQEDCGITPETVIAIGDQHNDRPMLEAAGLSVAMSNAASEIKQCADRVIGHHDQDGVAQFLEELFL